ncbi:hypothetical protein [Vannielia litorea]|uniref:hypothetical protein n=1 Tax=Vannielia litorea TaxID=1217970 RepID=UPI001C962773|nr:hypothetical protein [Vannielia litorea]MBY6049199.1 hypothetical protein [Vannielia litorea]MBY6076613.1 hypothetical protein [Vannielia litorea]
MRPDWLVPLLIFLLAMVLIALWFRLRSRRHAELAGSGAVAEGTAEPEVPEPGADAVPRLTASEEFREFPPEIQAVREELNRIRLEEAESEKAMLRMDEAQAAARAAIAEAQADADEAEAAVEADAEEEAPLAEVVEGEEDAPVDAIEPETEEDEIPEVEEALAQVEGPGETAEAESRWEVQVAAAADEPLEAEAVAEEISSADADGVEEVSSSNGAEDLHDSEGRLILPMGMGDIIVPTEAPRRLKLAVDRQWPIAVVQGFDPETERLVIFYDGPDATDIVMLPTIDDTWQINLGGRPVVQVECDAGAEALGSAVRIRMRSPE